MGLYVYKVMSKTKKIGNRAVHICKLAYKVSSYRDQNQKCHFQSGCNKKTNFKSDYFAIEGSDSIAIYRNTNLQSWFYDSALGTSDIEFVERIYK